MSEVPSLAAQVIITVIPIVGIVMASVVVFFYLLWHHRRTTLQIKMGTYEKPRFDLLSFSLLSGLLLSFLGVTLSSFLFLLRGVSAGLLGGLIPLALGVSLLLFYGVKRGESSR